MPVESIVGDIDRVCAERNSQPISEPIAGIFYCGYCRRRGDDFIEIVRVPVGAEVPGDQWEHHAAINNKAQELAWGIEIPLSRSLPGGVCIAFPSGEHVVMIYVGRKTEKGNQFVAAATALYVEVMTRERVSAVAKGDYNEVLADDALIDRALEEARGGFSLDGDENDTSSDNAL